MSVSQLDGQLYIKMIQAGAENLRRKEQEINDLNVFPIPDGDTGSNMCMTMNGGIAALSDDMSDISTASRHIADGMLMGARGNSGVILSQLFAGIADELEDCQNASAYKLAKAFRNGVKLAYSSVLKPTEGTILTVAREAADYAYSKSESISAIEDFFSEYIYCAKQSLEKTPQLLPVLAQAGVVDSGGAGLVCIAEGMMSAVDGRYELDSKPLNSQSAQTKQLDLNLFDENSIMAYGYCTECLLRLQNKKVNVESFSVDIISDYLNTIGNSVVILKNKSIVKIHVHTMTPGKVIDFCQQYGEFLTLKIENMQLQHNNTLADKIDGEQPTFAERKPYAVVAAVNGEGIKQIFYDQGADVIVEGGQCTNPSTEDFIVAFDKACADKIIVLPNNSNIILSAKQAAKLYKKSDVYVLENDSIGSGYAALSMLDTTSDNIDTIMDELRQATEGVRTIMISKSIRDTVLSDFDVKSGDYISISDKKIIACEKTKTAAARKAIKAAYSDDDSIILIIRGKTASIEEEQAVYDYVSREFVQTEVYTIYGEQDIYDFIIIME